MKRAGGVWAVLGLAVLTTWGSQPGSELVAHSGGGASAQQTQGGRPDAGAFIAEMAEHGMAEVQLGKLAAERASNADVKEFAQMMVQDHSKANEELKKIAGQLKVTSPTSLNQKHQALAAKLAKLQGAEFDREYMAQMVLGHEEVVNKLRMRAGDGLTLTDPASGRPATGTPAGGTGTQPTGGGSKPSGSAAASTSGGKFDPALIDWATKTLPTVQQHLERARTIQKQLGK
jgi:predicted outer membrane protein